MLRFLLQEHARLSLHAAILFAVGLYAAYPVVRFRMGVVAWPALALFRAVLRLLGPSPSLALAAGVIFSFNSVVIFLYMASGFHPLAPKLFAVWTGLNIGAIMGAVHRGEVPAGPLLIAPGQWRPPSWLGGVCGLMVLLLELPCFWLAIAMGMSLGHAVQADVPYLVALAPRALAYCGVVVSVLFVSAVAEAVAIRAAGCATGPNV